MPYAAVNDLTMYYEEDGPEDAVPLVLLHGFFGTGAAWEEQVSTFGTRYRVLVPDLRGHGQTDNPGGLAAMNHRQFGHDIVTFCDVLGIEQAIFCGQNTGAMLLLTIGCEAPDLVHALILSGSTYYYSDELRDWWRQQTPETVVSDIPAARAQHTALGPDHWRQLAQAFIALGAHPHADDFPELEELAEIQVPALIIHGDRDHFFPASVPLALYDILPDSELCILPNTGHGPPDERPDWFNAIALDFLLRRVPGAA